MAEVVKQACTRLPIWENSRRRKQLREFLTEADEFLAVRYDQDRIAYQAQRRAGVNRLIGGLGAIVEDAGLRTDWQYQDSATRSLVSLFENFYESYLDEIHRLPGRRHPTLDTVEQALGIYERDKCGSLRRVFWLPYWIETFIRGVLNYLGVTLPDRVVSLGNALINVIGVTAALLTILQKWFS